MTSKTPISPHQITSMTLASPGDDLSDPCLSQEMTCDLIRRQRPLSAPESSPPARPGPGRLVWAIRLLVNLVVAGTLVGVGFLTWFLLEQQQVSTGLRWWMGTGPYS